MVNVNSSFAQTISIDGVTVRGGYVDGNLANDRTTISNLGPFPITTSSPYSEPIKNLSKNYVYKIDVLSSDFTTAFGIHGYDYQNQNSIPQASSENQPPFMYNGVKWSYSTLAYHPTWDGDHFLKIKAYNITPQGTATTKNQGNVFVNIYRWSIVKTQSEDTVFTCERGKCSYSHTFGQTYCRDSDPYCNGGPCGSPGCP